MKEREGERGGTDGTGQRQSRAEQASPSYPAVAGSCGGGRDGKRRKRGQGDRQRDSSQLPVPSSQVPMYSYSVPRTLQASQSCPMGSCRQSSQVKEPRRTNGEGGGGRSLPEKRAAWEREREGDGNTSRKRREEEEEKLPR
ncbi:hypothetical protein V8C37DRAFT_98632 [Trichoderma ceciliae]